MPFLINKGRIMVLNEIINLVLLKPSHHRCFESDLTFSLLFFVLGAQHGEMFGDLLVNLANDFCYMMT